jgi:hypothetical protein
MRKKLWALNLLLLAGLALLARELHQNWKAARNREQRMLGKKAQPAPPPAPAQSILPPPVQAAAYLNVASQTLFSKDRNPNIVVEAPKEIPPPPFPKFYGVMNLGDGPSAIMSDGPARQKLFAIGDKAGEWKLTAIGADTLEFEWQQKKFTKRFTELQDKSETPAEVLAPRGPSASTPAPVTPAAPARPGPGVEMGGGFFACNPNDPSPAGTVLDGKRKVITDSMFGGKTCRWEPVK